MADSSKQENPNQPRPPPGYPTLDQNEPATGKTKFFRSKKKGERGFIEGCLFAICCCWICDMCN